MGHRANFVIIQNSSAKAFHDQWAALGCVFILEEGPTVAEAEVRKFTPTEELLDWCWAEGGYLLDFDQRLVIAFGPLETDYDFDGDDEVEDESDDDESEGDEVDSEAEAKQFLSKIAPKWSGWRLRWDDRGVDAFAEHLKARKIKGIRTQKRSHPAKPLKVEHQA